MNFPKKIFFPGEQMNTDDFFISGSSRPFDMLGTVVGGGSQFFPGGSLKKQNDNVTPDSGVEDNTPPDRWSPKIGGEIPPLKNLAREVAFTSDLLKKPTKGTRFEGGSVGEKLGGLRHTRDKLKLDLPPSPSAFANNCQTKHFNYIEQALLGGEGAESRDEVGAGREKPAFTTFGKSRFVVQHVDTPPEEEDAGVGGRSVKNVSFEALPYKPENRVLKGENSSLHATPRTGAVVENDGDEGEKSVSSCYKPDSVVETHLIGDFGVGAKGGKVEMVRGEASLLDSADEDSGIESSTVERRLADEIN